MSKKIYKTKIVLEQKEFRFALSKTDLNKYFSLFLRRNFGIHCKYTFALKIIVLK